MASKKSNRQRVSESLRDRSKQFRQQTYENKIEESTTVLKEENDMSVNLQEDQDLAEMLKELEELENNGSTTSTEMSDKDLAEAMAETNVFGDEGNGTSVGDLADPEEKTEKEMTPEEKKQARENAREAAKIYTETSIRKGEDIVKNSPNRVQLQKIMSQFGELVGFITRDDSRADIVQKKVYQNTGAGSNKIYRDVENTLPEGPQIPAARRAANFNYALQMKPPTAPVGAIFYVPEKAEKLLARGHEPKADDPDFVEAVADAESGNPAMKVTVLGKDFVAYVAKYFYVTGVKESQATFSPVGKTRKTGSTVLTSPARYKIKTRPVTSASGTEAETKVILVHTEGRTTLVTPTNYISLNRYESVTLDYDTVVQTDEDGTLRFPIFENNLKKYVSEVNTVENKLVVPQLTNLLNKQDNVFFQATENGVVSPLFTPEDKSSFNQALKSVKLYDWAITNANGELTEVTPKIVMKEKVVNLKSDKVTYRILKNKLFGSETRIERVKQNGKVVEREVINKYHWDDPSNTNIQAFINATHGALTFEVVELIGAKSKATKEKKATDLDYWYDAQNHFANNTTEGNPISEEELALISQ